jgi:DNA-binding CsgD family transcriptional regulator/tetratricopeptide (TPR) repeat protein
MDQNVAVISRARVSLDDAFSAWFEGAFEQCLTCCDELDAQGSRLRETTLLRARALLRVERADEALSALESIRAEDDVSDGELTRRMLIAVARTRVGDVVRGLEELYAIQAVMRHTHPSIQSEVVLNIGLTQYMLRDLDAADTALDQVAVDTDIIHARSLEYKAWVASARGDYPAAERLFAQALTRLDACEHYDRFLEANCLQALAYLAVDGLERHPWAAIAARRARVRWEESGLSYPLFRLTLSAATYENDIEGRPVQAAIEARRAYELAPSAAYRALALCKRAAIVRCAREPIAQGDHLHAAIDLFESLDVARLAGDERLVPVALAEELANAGRAREARTYFEAYLARAATSMALAITGDVRRESYEQLVEAQIAEAEERKAEAVALYEKVLNRPTAASVRHAVIAAVRLGRMGNSSQLARFTALAVREVQQTSWISIALKGLGEASTRAKLTRLQNEYLEMMCRGLSNPDIAKMRGRSVNTVRNQVAAIFVVFGVHSRSELIAECVRIGRLS